MLSRLPRRVAATLANPTMLARLLRTLIVLNWALVIGWGMSWWSRSPLVAVAGALFVLNAHAPTLAFQFVWMWRSNRTDPAPRASMSQVVRAWWQETAVARRVFGWEQPFRSRRVPDSTAGSPRRRPGVAGVVLIHGFVCNRGFWTPWLEDLQARGACFEAVNLEPVFASIDQYVGAVDAAVMRLTALTGRPPVLVCHSMGGLVARAWLRSGPNADRVRHVVTIGTPHAGTALAAWSTVPNGRQMQQASKWLAALEADEALSRQPPFTCWYTNCDNIVFPCSTATLPRAVNRLRPGLAHVALAFDDEVMRASMELIVTPPAGGEASV